MIAIIRHIWHLLPPCLVGFFYLVGLLISVSVFLNKTKFIYYHYIFWGIMTLLVIAMQVRGIYIFLVWWEVWIEYLSPHHIPDDTIMYALPYFYLLFCSNFALKFTLISLPCDIYFFRHRFLLKYVCLKYCIILLMFAFIATLVYLNILTFRAYHNEKEACLGPEIRILFYLCPDY